VTLKNPCDRIAAKVVASEVRRLLHDPDDDSLGMHPLAPIVQIMQLHKNDVRRLKRRLKQIADRLDRDADLPERIVDWRKTLE